MTGGRLAEQRWRGPQGAGSQGEGGTTGPAESRSLGVGGVVIQFQISGGDESGRDSASLLLNN